MTGARFRSLPAVVAALLLVSTALLILGVVREHRGNETTPQHPTTSEPAGHSEEDGDEHAGETSTPAEATGETVLGARAESPEAVTAATVASILLAGLIWRRPNRWIAAAVTVFAAGAAFVDVVEISHQASEGRGSLAVLAAVIALGHITVGAGAVVLWRRAGADRAQLRPATR